MYRLHRLWQTASKIPRSLHSPRQVNSIILARLKLLKEPDSIYVRAAQGWLELGNHLACYGAQLGRLWEAEQWLKQALNIGDRAALKRAALADSDLKPLWPKIKGL